MHRAQLNRFSVAILILAMASMACSIGVLTPSDPLFAAPANAKAGEATPVRIFATAEVQEPIITPTVAGIEEVGVSGAIPAPTMDPNIAPILYYTQAGDTLPVVAVRFSVEPEEIMSPDPIPEVALLPPNQLLVIPHRLANTTSSIRLLPDSELVFSPSAIGMDMDAFVQEAGGYLSTYREWLGSSQWTSGVDVIYRVAIENSINPRLLMALLEYQSGWVYGQPANLVLKDYPMGKIDSQQKELYQQLSWAVNILSTGYYGWREGHINEIVFSDGATARLAPDLNAGTVALQYYFAHIFDSEGWLRAMDPENGFAALYERMFGSPWVRSLQVEPLYPPDLMQPEMILPFFIGQMWAFTGGPHGAWEYDGARAALDFSPARTVSGCVESDAWVLAIAAGLVVRSDNGIVVIDLDGDGSEQTGWAVLYLHIAQKGRVPLGTWVEAGDLVGHPSCEGGRSTGTHVHIARKYNGEWIPAAGPLPFTMDGWVAHAGDEPYEGYLTREEETVWASVVGSFESRIIRTRSKP